MSEPWGDVEQIDDATLEADDAALVAMSRQAAFAKDVAEEAWRIRVRTAARDKVDAEEAAQAPPFDAGTLEEILARPADPPHRVEGLIPSEAGTLVVAQRKTGKTTLQLGLARALILGETFLGRFTVRPIAGRVGFLNFEVSAVQLARWAADVGIPPDRFYQVNLRGRRNPFGNDDDRAVLADRLREQQVETLVVDPFGRAFTGRSQNDPGEVGAWLADLDRFARGDCGVTDVVLAAHAGWDGERTRGSSALEDWADVVVTLVRDRDDDQLRFLRAEGRDVLVEEDRLDFQPDTRTLRLAGAGSRRHAAKARQVEELVTHVVTCVTDAPGINGTALGVVLRDRGLSFQKGDERKAANIAVDRGLLSVERGLRGAKEYHLPRHAPTSPNGAGPTYPDPTYRGGVGGQDRSTPDLPQPDSVLDWRGSEHWSDRQLPCRHCGVPTNLRDDSGDPAHKTCVEEREAVHET